MKSLHNWTEYTEEKEALFFYTHTNDAPWTVIKSASKSKASKKSKKKDDKSWSDQVGKTIVLRGVLDNSKSGPALTVKEICKYDAKETICTSKKCIWHDLPVFVHEEAGIPLQGISVSKNTDLHKASKRYLLTDFKIEILK